MMRYQSRALRGIHSCLKRKQLCVDNVRLIFSKTGTWDPKLSRDVRLEIEEHWKPLVTDYDQQQASLSNSPEDCNKEKFYALSMFPYPSGNLHMGHVRVYTISDVMARYQRLKGKMVIHPMGWDAFGLPAENAAIERGVRPKDWTYSNIEVMRKQLKNLGLSLDWSREFATCDPEYYKWTQYIFLKMFEEGLVFQQKGLVNWDPVDMTVLAAEQIDETGRSWRSGVAVEQKYLKQWYLRNTVFSESLLEGLNEVDLALWRDIILLQRNWISELKGHRMQFDLVTPDGSEESPLSVYTENLDLIYGVSHLYVAPSHHLCKDFGVMEEGSALPVKAVHPLTKERLNIVVTAEENIISERDVMLGIPSISESSRVTANRLGVPAVNVLDPSTNTLINSHKLTGLSREDALEEVCKKAMQLGVGGERISARLRDWLISRQRYWGTPIPIIHCPKCKAVPVPYQDLPVELPDRDQLTSKDGKSPLAEDEEWLNVECPNCGGPAQRETDTMDTFVDSSWYFLRYLDPHNKTMPFDPEVVGRLMPVDLYVGGKEHAVLHLYFARFFHHFLHSVGLVKHREPFRDLLTQGMVKAMTYRIEETGQYFHVSDVDLSGPEPVVAKTGQRLVAEWSKMGKSTLNGINPEDVLSEFGLDSTRLCMLSNVAPQSDRNWCNSAYKGVLNWQGRVWSLVTRHRESNSGQGSDGGGGCEADGHPEVTDMEMEEWERKINNTRNHIINNVNFQFDRTFNINSAISRLQSLVSWLLQVPTPVAASSAAYERCLADLVIMVSPMAPHFASELWQGLGPVAQVNSHHWEKGVLEQSWPVLDEDFLMPMTLEVNHVKISEVGIPFKDFDNLTSSHAVDVVRKDSLFQERFGTMTVAASHLKVVKGHKATLNLTIPEYDPDLQGKTASEKNKKRKELGKKKKKLHKM